MYFGRVGVFVLLFFFIQAQACWSFDADPDAEFRFVESSSYVLRHVVKVDTISWFYMPLLEILNERTDDAQYSQCGRP